jgi:hypothetical protein
LVIYLSAILIPFCAYATFAVPYGLHFSFFIFFFIFSFFHFFIFSFFHFFIFSGVRTPISVDDIKVQLPHVYADLMTIQKQLEKHYRDMQDIEFTGDEYLYILLYL